MDFSPFSFNMLEAIQDGDIFSMFIISHMVKNLLASMKLYKMPRGVSTAELCVFL